MENSTVEWVEGSLGSKVSYTYPSTVLKGEGAKTSIIGVTIANGPFWKENGGLRRITMHQGHQVR